MRWKSQLFPDNAIYKLIALSLH